MLGTGAGQCWFAELGCANVVWPRCLLGQDLVGLGKREYCKYLLLVVLQFVFFHMNVTKIL